MDTNVQKERALQLRQFHHAAPMLVLPNVWDPASARVLELAGSRAVATTSSGIAAALGYGDGQKISREMLAEATTRITRVVTCPVSADIEAGFGDSVEEVCQTVRAIIEAGAVGINIEDSLKQGTKALVDISYQTTLLKALRDLAEEMDIPLVINARVDVFLLAIGEPETRFEHAVQRANAYLEAGADCAYPIGRLERDVIARLVKAINGPINIMGGPPMPTLPELAELGVARVSLAGSVMRAALGHLRVVAQELLEQGTYNQLSVETLSSAEFGKLFPD